MTDQFRNNLIEDRQYYEDHKAGLQRLIQQTPDAETRRVCILAIGLCNRRINDINDLLAGSEEHDANGRA